MARVGVLALQGAFVEHQRILTALGAKVVEVRGPNALDELDALILPGGESTAIGRLMQSANLLDPLRIFAASGRPLWGTCAGMILMAKEIGPEPPWLGVMEIQVARNAFGRQQDSFEVPLKIPSWGIDAPFMGVFIRAPELISASPNVEVVARLPNGTAVAACQNHLWVTAFHPELSGDDRIHRAFLSRIGT